MMTSKLDLLKKYLDLQAQDESLWFVADTITEDILQTELRKIAYLIEEATPEAIKLAIKSYEEKLEEQ